MPEETQYTVHLADGSTYGPAPVALLRQWAGEGRLTPQTPLHPAGGGAPRPAGTLPELAVVFEALADAPAPAASALAPTTPPRSTSPPESPARPARRTRSWLFPAGNPAALSGYYLAILGLCLGIGLLVPYEQLRMLAPLAGICCGLLATLLGVAGLGRRLRHAEAEGLLHALVAIVLGLAAVTGYVVLIVLMFRSGQWTL